MKSLDALSSAEQTTAFHAMEELRRLGFTAVHHGEFQFQLQQPKRETVAFESPYVSVLGEMHGLSPDTPIVTEANFIHFFRDKYAPDSSIRDVEASGRRLFREVKQEADESLASSGMAWHVPYKPNVDGPQNLGVSPRGVVALLGRYETADDIPGSIMTNRVRKSVWLGFADHLAKVQHDTRPSRKQKA